MNSIHPTRICFDTKLDSLVDLNSTKNKLKQLKLPPSILFISLDNECSGTWGFCDETLGGNFKPLN